MHILTAEQFSRSQLLKIFRIANQLKRSDHHNSRRLFAKSKGIVLLFYQPSTRTHASFEIASKLLGLRILYSTQAANQFSSAVKGESLEDTIELFCNYPGTKIIVLRHPESGSANLASQIADLYGVNIINAGDGRHEHPTQAILDLYTIFQLKEKKKTMNKIRLVVANDIEYSRTIRSLCLLFAKAFRPKEIGVCAPKGVHLPEDVAEKLEGLGVRIIYFYDLKKAALWADFLYMTRPQIEYYLHSKSKKLAKRFQDFRINQKFLENIPPKYPCQILHPMPIDSKNFNEITAEARHHPRCKIFQQAKNGIYIRMALLKILLSQKL